ncbi:dockerin type I domain-containing protein [Ruminococcus albus]|uniref:Dockerin domain-containing protein n=1 Tax=Ruminococcus albus TaxID=1264 RepID=A0A1H7KS59_RUMAL|nr:dockerin type I domain-containing protein [Ruminococcus albus]SEK89370.1 hypothetical protein SAMN05216469_10772 [Ruminococcus albus]
MKRMLAGIMAVTMTFSGAILPAEQVWKGAGVICASAENLTSPKTLTSDVTVSGSVQTNSDIILNGHTLTINGDLYMTAGMLDVGTGKLIVKGSLYIGKDNASSKAYIRMQSSSGSITVSKDLIWNVDASMTNTVGRSGWYTYDLITAGTINVGGNVCDCISSADNHNAFAMMGTSVLNFNGTGNQTLKCSYQGEMAKITVTNNRTIGMEGYFYSTTPLASNLNIETKNGLKIITMMIGGKTVNITGDVTQFERNIELGGGTLNITGNFTAQGGSTKLGGGKLNVNGDYRIAKVNSNGTLGTASAGLDMTNIKDVVTVSGNFIVKTYYNTTTNNVTMSAGKMYVGGDFDCSSPNITISSGNTVYMNGKSPQTVKLTDKKKIYNLVLTQDISQYNSDIANYAVNLVTNQSKITADSVTLSTTSYVYDGTAKQPAVTVKIGSKTLTKGTDYTVTYSANTDAGTASVTVRGMGSYSGSVTKNFTINKKNISSLSKKLSQTSYTYDGTAKKPTVTIKDGTRTLSSGTDYSISYSNNTNVGTATVNITGKGNYTGTASLSFKIVKQGESTIAKGDVNGDGTINTTDLTKAAAHVKGKKILSAEEQKRADVNGDGVVNTTDVTKIAAHVKGKKMLK